MHYEDYTDRYTNPYKKRQKKQSFNLKKYFLPSILIFWVSLLLYLPYFKIDQVTYFGLKIIKQQEVEDLINNEFLKSKSWIPKNNYFLVRERKIAEFIKNKYSINSVVVSKNFPNEIQIQIEEKISAAVFDNGSGYYMIDENGVVIKKLIVNSNREISTSSSTTSTAVYTTNTPSNLTISTSTTKTTTTTTTTTEISKSEPSRTPDVELILNEVGKFPILFSNQTKEVTEGDKIFNSETIRGFIDFYNGLEKGRVVKFRYAEIGQAEAGITIYLEKPWKVRFQPTNDIQNQLNNLQIILKNNQPTEYIDLRFGERIYWK